MNNEDWIIDKRVESLRKSQDSTSFWRKSLDQNWREAILKATPRSVWDAYHANGYTMRDAIREECEAAQ